MRLYSILKGIMIAHPDYYLEGEVTEPTIIRGEWNIIQTFDRSDLERIAGASFPEKRIRNGFRQYPINPRKRVKSFKRKKR